MVYKEAIKMLCQLEGKKVQVSVGNVREIMRILKIVFKTENEHPALGYPFTTWFKKYMDI